jgi:hypothetical protein
VVLTGGVETSIMVSVCWCWDPILEMVMVLYFSESILRSLFKFNCLKINIFDRARYHSFFQMDAGLGMFYENFGNSSQIEDRQMHASFSAASLRPNDDTHEPVLVNRKPIAMYKKPVPHLVAAKPALLQEKDAFFNKLLIPRKSLTCDICEARFVNRFTLNRHYNTHKQERPLVVCKYCEKKFTRPDNLKAHMIVVHAGEMVLKSSDIE